MNRLKAAGERLKAMHPRERMRQARLKLRRKILMIAAGLFALPFVGLVLAGSYLTYHYMNGNLDIE